LRVAFPYRRNAQLLLIDQCQIAFKQGVDLWEEKHQNDVVEKEATMTRLEESTEI
jgi:hypothetical protein